MVECRLLGSVWATRKYDELSGLKLMRVEVLEGSEAGTRLVCADTIGAGCGERVLVARGSAAYHFMAAELGHPAPVDAAIVGIIDGDCDC